MASAKPVVVVINGEEYVSKAAKDAETGLDNFQKKTGGWINGLADLKAGWDFLSARIGQAWQMVKDSIAANDEMRAAQRKLEGTSKLTGVALEDLRVIAEVGRGAFKLSTTTASDFAAEIAKLTQKAGDTDKAAEALAAFLNIGAARGLGAAETLVAVQQAILGIDEGTDKLFNKNPSVIYEEFARAIGTTAGKLSDQQKAQALLNEALEGGIRTYGEYAKYLESSAGKAALFEQANREAAAQLGESLDTLRKDLLDIGGTVVPWYYDTWRRNADDLTATLKTLQSSVYNLWSGMAKLFGNATQAEIWAKKSEDAAMIAAKATDRANKSAQELAEANTMVKVELDKVIPTYKSTADAAGSLLRPLGESSRLFASNAEEVAKVGPRANMSAKEIANYGTVSVKSAGDAEKAQKKATEAYIEAHKRWLASMEMLYKNALTTTQVMEKLHPAVMKAFEPERVKTFNDVMDKSRQVGDELVAKMKQVGIDPPQLTTVEKLKLELSKAAENVWTTARGALDLAQAFGVLDRDSASALSSVANIGSAVQAMAKTGFSFAGVTGVLGGVANIVSLMMQGDLERRRLTRENTVALDKLRTEGVRLSDRASGEQIAGVSQALRGVDGDALSALAKTPGGNRAVTGFLTSYLSKLGLRLSDLDAVASELGFNLRRSDGTIDGTQLPFLLTALTENSNALTRIPQTFGAQLDFFKQGQDLTGATGTTKISGLLDFLTGGAGNIGALRDLDLTNPTQARSKLFDLLTLLNSGGLAPELLGKATGEQFRTILTDLIRMIDELSTDSGGSGATGLVTGGGSGNLVSGGGSAQTMQDVLTAMDTNLGGILSAHTAIHERVAAATEGSYVELQQINAKMDELIVVTAERIDATDAKLEAMRRMAALERGVLPRMI